MRSPHVVFQVAMVRQEGTSALDRLTNDIEFTLLLR